MSIINLIRNSFFFKKLSENIISLDILTMESFVQKWRYMMNEMYEVSLDEKWKNATIANNFIFYKVMHNNPEVCKELLEILLEIKIDKIEMKQEETIEIDYGKKGVRLDVYASGHYQCS